MVPDTGYEPSSEEFNLCSICCIMFATLVGASTFVMMLDPGISIEQKSDSIGIFIGMLLLCLVVILTPRTEKKRKKERAKARPRRRKVVRLPRPHTAFQRDRGSSFSEVRLQRFGSFIGNRIRFKVTITNTSRHTITDVKVFLLTYPRETLTIPSDDDDIFFTKIDAGASESPFFDLEPTQDCVQGNIVAGISFIDNLGKPHTLTTRPFVVRAVCDLLQPESISPTEFILKLDEMKRGEISIFVEEWTPEEMHERVLKVLQQSNFHEVESKMSDAGEVFVGKITGWARGKYTGKRLGVELYISGRRGKTGSACRIKVSGEDQAMIISALDDLKERVSSWLCPSCGSKLSIPDVMELKKGQSIECHYCGVVIRK